MTSVEVREQLVDALRLDLVGPLETAAGRQLGDPNELLSQAPSRWYLMPRSAQLLAAASGSRARGAGHDSGR